ncbi:TatD family hydrolase [Lachnospiraceae bacterium C1.1]|nr:TatD family hydrolase [Lachnospiraceae bacterium C1.1]
MIKIFDTHAHYDDSRFDEDRENAIKKIREAGVRHFVNVASDLKSVDTCLNLVKEHEESYAALGIIPGECGDITENDIVSIGEKLSSFDRAVAVGEIGLDYYWKENPAPEIQKKWFIRQLDLARQTNKPVVIHSRDAAADTLEIMKAEDAGKIGGVIHCFSYSPEIAAEYVKMGFFLGIGGVVTFKNAKKTVEVVRKMPLETLVLETDCPYLAPTPHRGERNSSDLLPNVAERIAEIKEISVDEVYEKTYENALRLYRIEE